ncbi:acetylcholinesterase, putative, partial [Ixodes scapularis]
AVSMSTVAALPQEHHPSLYTRSGKLKGVKREAFGRPVDVFYGIPYAVPPLGKLRFQRPIPVKPWKGFRDATQPPFPCKQPDFFVTQNYTVSAANSTEDCLYLNVWTPARYCFDLFSCGLKAVMVYIYGGSFTYGSSSWSFYDGLHLAASGDVVVVTFNYRVGIFGFLSTKIDGITGNQGMHDQVLALRWIKENIVYFGGNADLVTVFGQSAGAISVGYHLVSPLSKGLFKRAIMESGSPLWLLHDDRTNALRKSQTLASALGCTKDFGKAISDPEVLECMRNKNATELLNVAAAALGPQAETFFPTDDGLFLAHNADVLLDTMKSADVDLLIGNNKNEGTFFVSNFLSRGLKFDNVEHITKDELGFYMLLFFRTLMRSGVSEIRDFYFGKFDSTDNTKVLQRGSDSIGDFIITCPSRFFAERYQSKGRSVYYYQFSHRPSFSIWPPWMGTTHFDEFPFVFGHAMAFPELVTAEESMLSRHLVHVWTTFAKTGKMPTLGKHAWPKYTKAGPYLMDISLKNFTIRKGPQEENCRFWRGYFAGGI